MKNSVIKRVWAWIMVACMLFTMVPAFAEGTEILEESAPTAEVTEPEVTEPAGEEVISDEAEALPAEDEAEPEADAGEADDSEAAGEPEAEPSDEPVVEGDPETDGDDAASDEPVVDEPVADEPIANDGIELTEVPENFEETCTAADHEGEPHDIKCIDWSVTPTVEPGPYSAGDCTHAGTYHVKCKWCGKFGPIRFEQVHHFTEYTYDGTFSSPVNSEFKVPGSADPTCTKAGYAIQRCAECNQYATSDEYFNGALGDHYYKEVDALEHAFVQDEKGKVEPTCTEPGSYATVHCSRCGKIWTKDTIKEDDKFDPKAELFVIKETGHTWETQFLPADCGHNDRDVDVCTTCGAQKDPKDRPNGNKALGGCQFTSYIPVNGYVHTGILDKSIDDTPLTEGTGTENNKHMRVCRNCGAVDTEWEKTNRGGKTCTYVLQENESVDNDCVHRNVRVFVCKYCGERVTLLGKSGPTDTKHTFTSNKWIGTDGKILTCKTAKVNAKAFKYCDVCGQWIDNNGNAVANVLAAASANNAITLTQDIIDTMIHTWVAKPDATDVAATCKAAGHHLEECSECGETRTVTDPQLPHNYKWTVTSEDCETDLYGEMKCTVCGDVIAGSRVNYEGTRGSHQYTITEYLREPDCQMAGLVAVECSVCHEKTTQPVAALEHTWKDVTFTNDCNWKLKSTVSAPKTFKQCQVCGALDGIDTSEWDVTYNQHDFDGDGDKDDDHGNDGWKSDGHGGHIRTCAVCGKTYHQTCDNSLSGNLTAVATCVSKGYDYQQCVKCGYEKISEEYGTTNANNHVGALAQYQNDTTGKYWHWEPTANSRATCTTAGWVNKVCACGAVLPGSNNLAFRTVDHTWGEPVQGKPATCTQTGEETVTCTVCGAKETRVVPKTQHEFAKKTTPATCEEEGKEGYFCIYCGAEDPFNPAKKVADKLDHQYDLEGEPDKIEGADDCTVDTVAYYNCKLCGKAPKTVVLTKAGEHKWDENSEFEIKDATCTTPEMKIFLCDVCHQPVVEQVVGNGQKAYTEEYYGTGRFVEANFVYDQKTFVYHWINTNRAEWLAEQTFTYEDSNFCTVTCPICGDKIYLKHQQDTAAGTVYGDADCVNNAYRAYKCVNCEGLYAIDILTKNHEDGVGDTEDNSKTTIKRDKPDPTQPHQKDADGNYYSHEEFIKGDCTTGGIYREICDKCGAVIKVDRKTPGSHKLDKGVENPKRTCVQDGTLTQTCETCGATVITTLTRYNTESDEHLGVPADHTTWEVTKEATEEEKGERHAVCTQCGEDVTEEFDYDEGECKHETTVEAYDHDNLATLTICAKCGALLEIVYFPSVTPEEKDCSALVYDAMDGTEQHGVHFLPDGTAKEEVAATPATCTKPGTVAGTKCTVCGKVVGEGTPEPAKGHTWERDFDITLEANRTEENGWVVDEEAQPGVAGKGHYECTDPDCDAETTPAKSAEVTIEALEQIKIRTTKRALLREAASDSSKLHAVVDKGTEFVVVSGPADGYYEIVYTDDVHCFVQETYVEVVK